MLRNAFIVFILGWIIWFWTDKPHRGLEHFLQTDDSMLINFQRAFDLLKSGYLEQSFIYIWNAHYILLSLIGGVILSGLYRFFADMLSRKRAHSRFVLKSTSKQQQASNTEHSSEQ